MMEIRAARRNSNECLSLESRQFLDLIENASRNVLRANAAVSAAQEGLVLDASPRINFQPPHCLQKRKRHSAVDEMEPPLKKIICDCRLAFQVDDAELETPRIGLLDIGNCSRHEGNPNGRSDNVPEHAVMAICCQPQRERAGHVENQYHLGELCKLLFDWFSFLLTSAGVVPSAANHCQLDNEKNNDVGTSPLRLTEMPSGLHSSVQPVTPNVMIDEEKWELSCHLILTEPLVPSCTNSTNINSEIIYSADSANQFKKQNLVTNTFTALRTECPLRTEYPPCSVTQTLYNNSKLALDNQSAEEPMEPSVARYSFACPVKQANNCTKLLSNVQANKELANEQSAPSYSFACPVVLANSSIKLASVVQPTEELMESNAACSLDCPLLRSNANLTSGDQHTKESVDQNAACCSLNCLLKQSDFIKLPSDVQAHKEPILSSTRCCLLPCRALPKLPEDLQPNKEPSAASCSFTLPLVLSNSSTKVKSNNQCSEEPLKPTASCCSFSFPHQLPSDDQVVKEPIKRAKTSIKTASNDQLYEEPMETAARCSLGFPMALANTLTKVALTVRESEERMQLNAASYSFPCPVAPSTKLVSGVQPNKKHVLPSATCYSSACPVGLSNSSTELESNFEHSEEPMERSADRYPFACLQEMAKSSKLTFDVKRSEEPIERTADSYSFTCPVEQANCLSKLVSNVQQNEKVVVSGAAHYSFDCPLTLCDAKLTSGDRPTEEEPVLPYSFTCPLQLANRLASDDRHTEEQMEPRTSNSNKLALDSQRTEEQMEPSEPRCSFTYKVNRSTKLATSDKVALVVQPSDERMEPNAASSSFTCPVALSTKLVSCVQPNKEPIVLNAACYSFACPLDNSSTKLVPNMQPNKKVVVPSAAHYLFDCPLTLSDIKLMSGDQPTEEPIEPVLPYSFACPLKLPNVSNRLASNDQHTEEQMEPSEAGYSFTCPVNCSTKLASNDKLSEKRVMPSASRYSSACRLGLSNSLTKLALDVQRSSQPSDPRAACHSFARPLTLSDTKVASEKQLSEKPVTLSAATYSFSCPVERPNSSRLAQNDKFTEPLVEPISLSYSFACPPEPANFSTGLASNDRPTDGQMEQSAVTFSSKLAAQPLTQTKRRRPPTPFHYGIESDSSEEIENLSDAQKFILGLFGPSKHHDSTQDERDTKNVPRGGRLSAGCTTFNGNQQKFLTKPRCRLLNKWSLPPTLQTPPRPAFADACSLLHVRGLDSPPPLSASPVFFPPPSTGPLSSSSEGPSRSSPSASPLPTAPPSDPNKIAGRTESPTTTEDCCSGGGGSLSSPAATRRTLPFSSFNTLGLLTFSDLFYSAPLFTAKTTTTASRSSSASPVFSVPLSKNPLPLQCLSEPSFAPMTSPFSTAFRFSEPRLIPTTRREPAAAARRSDPREPSGRAVDSPLTAPSDAKVFILDCFGPKPVSCARSTNKERSVTRSSDVSSRCSVQQTSVPLSGRARCCESSRDKTCEQISGKKRRWDHTPPSTGSSRDSLVPPSTATKPQPSQQRASFSADFSEPLSIDIPSPLSEDYSQSSSPFSSASPQVKRPFIELLTNRPDDLGKSSRDDLREAKKALREARNELTETKKRLRGTKKRLRRLKKRLEQLGSEGCLDGKELSSLLEKFFSGM